MDNKEITTTNITNIDNAITIAIRIAKKNKDKRQACLNIITSLKQLREMVQLAPYDIDIVDKMIYSILNIGLDNIFLEYDIISKKMSFLEIHRKLSMIA